MSATSKPSLRSDVWEYLKAAGYGWWLILATLSGAWSRLSPMLPRAWSKQMSPEFALVLAFVALVVGPFQAFRKVLRKLEAAEQKTERLRSDYRRAFMDEKIELFHGESSRKSRAQRAAELKALYEPRRDEIRRGDFTRASEVIPILKHYVPLFRQVVPSESVALEMQVDEFKEIMDKVEGHIAETMRPSDAIAR